MKVHVIEGRGISSNVYVLEAERPAIVDAGILEYAGDTIARIKETGLKPDILLLTHRHVDHIGAARRIAEEFSISEVYAGERDADAIRSADDSTGAKAFGLGIESVDAIPLSDEDSIDMGNSELRVMETPGHTAGSISLFEPGEKALFPGDTIFADGGVGRWDLPTGNLRELIGSVERLLSLDAVSMYPGHGDIIKEGAVSHIRRSLDALRYYSPSSFSD